MAKPTLEEYLSYLSVEPRTKGWGALLVYDRFKTNMLLAQEHIERFDGSHWLKPISLRVETEGGSWTDISELTLDKPSLSFVNSNISSSAARLSMHVSGGKFKQLRKALGSGQTELVGLSRLDPLSAPAVRMNINLNQSNNGTITDEGRVTLDLSQGSAYTFEVSSWKDLNEKVGSAIQRTFAALPAEERVWELNTLKPVEGELKPTSFAVRTHSLAKAGQSIVSSDPAELDEGAVVVGVAFNGARGGDFPTRDEDMPYLLPESGSSDPFTMNLLVGNDVWSKQVLAQMFKKVPGYENEQPEYESQAGFITQLTWPGLTVTSLEQTHRFPTPHLYEGLDGAISARRIDGFKAWRFDLLRTSVNMTLASKGGVVVLEWKGQWPPSGEDHPVLESDEFIWRANGGNGSLAVKYPVAIDYTCRQNFALELETAGEHKGRVKVVKKEQQIDVALAQYDGRQFVWLEEVFKTAQDLFKTSFKNAFDQVVTAVASAGASIDVLRLNGLLFRSEHIAEPRNLQVPGDLSLLGTLAPKLTAFSLGADAPLPVGDGQWLIGVMAGHSGSDLGLVRGASAEVKSYYLGLYATWLDAQSGYYLDGVVKLNRFDNSSKIALSDGTRTKGDYDNLGVGASVEFGRHLDLGAGYFIEPYTQWSVVNIQGKDYQLDNGLQAQGDDTRSLLGKAGTTVGRTFELGEGRLLQPYLRAAYAHEFVQNNQVRVNNNRFDNDLSGSRGELGLGVAATLNDRLQLHADFDYANGEKIEQPWGANVGLRYSW